MERPRLDILLYAHDGRGLGHASRTIAIGMALRRLAPSFRVLFVSGCKVSRELIGPTTLDWLKLPSYETEVVDGKSRGVQGHSMFTDRQLGELRAEQLRKIVELYRPRLVLADHTPQGKHRELVPAVEHSPETTWVLGVRGVIGDVSQTKSELARQIFAAHYSALFWYGDPAVLGESHRDKLMRRFGNQPLSCGYVSRLREMSHWQKNQIGDNGLLAGTLSIPWLGEHTVPFLGALAEALTTIGPAEGNWHLFIDPGPDAGNQEQVRHLFQSIPHCHRYPLSGAAYVQSLQRSRCALIYGGYNSVMDVLALSLPAVVVLRAMSDNEQQAHLGRLEEVAGGLLQSVEETAAGPHGLVSLLRNALHSAKSTHSIALNGAAHAAKRLLALLG